LGVNEPLTFLAASPELMALGLRMSAELGAPLRALIGFGSALSPRMRKQGSIPDVLAVVDDVDAALRRLGEGRLVRAMAGILPPIIVAYGDGRSGATLAKLNLIAASTALHEVRAGRDLYLAGRLSKPVALLWTRDAASGRAALELHDAAIRRVAAVTLAGLAGDVPLAEVVTRTIALSYRAELRPEGATKFAAIHAAFPEFYLNMLPALLREEATRLGFNYDGAVLCDRRDESERARQRRGARRLLLRSRIRVVARMLRQLVVYRGALEYLRGKIRRIRAG
jgi:hypothetical protein